MKRYIRASESSQGTFTKEDMISYFNSVYLPVVPKGIKLDIPYRYKGYYFGSATYDEDVFSKSELEIYGKVGNNRKSSHLLDFEILTCYDDIIFVKIHPWFTDNFLDEIISIGEEPDFYHPMNLSQLKSIGSSLEDIPKFTPEVKSLFSNMIQDNNEKVMMTKVMKQIVDYLVSQYSNSVSDLITFRIKTVSRPHDYERLYYELIPKDANFDVLHSKRKYFMKWPWLSIVVDNHTDFASDLSESLKSKYVTGTIDIRTELHCEEIRSSEVIIQNLPFDGQLNLSDVDVDTDLFRNIVEKNIDLLSEEYVPMKVDPKVMKEIKDYVQNNDLYTKYTEIVNADDYNFELDRDEFWSKVLDMITDELVDNGFDERSVNSDSVQKWLRKYSEPRGDFDY